MSGPIVRKWTGLGSLGPYFLSDILVQNYKLRLIDEYYNYNTNTFNTITSDQNIGPQIGQKIQTKISQVSPFTDYSVQAVISRVEN